MSISEKNHQYYTIYYIVCTYFWPTLYKTLQVAYLNSVTCSCNREYTPFLVNSTLIIDLCHIGTQGLSAYSVNNEVRSSVVNETYLSHLTL